MNTFKVDPKPVLTSVLVSILNWNSAEKSITCVRTLLSSFNAKHIKIKILLIDNGSGNDDYSILLASNIASEVEIIRNDVNLGFAGGHNYSITYALRNHFSYVWLLNNDAIVRDDTLTQLVEAMEKDPQCGALSPIILALDDPSRYDFCGAVINWHQLESNRADSPEQGQKFQQLYGVDTWIAGTAALYRVGALANVGMLQEELFAYYEDNDICVRLSRAGWVNQVCTGAIVLHARHVDMHAERPAYYFYLMIRNSFYFWLKHTPQKYKRCVRYRLACRGFILANQMLARGETAKQVACLLGVEDGLRSRWGRPLLERRPASVTRWLSRNYLHSVYERLDRFE